MDKWLAPALSALSSEFTDCCVIVDSQRFKCHKIILAAGSEFFKQMLLSDFKESITGEIFLEDVSPETFEKLRNYIYTYNRCTLESYDDYTLKELYECGSKWLVKSITDDCLTVLCNRARLMDVEALIDLYELAHRYEDKMFIVKITHFLIQKLKELPDRALLLSPPVFMQFMNKIAIKKAELKRFNFIVKYLELHGFSGSSTVDAMNKLDLNDNKDAINEKIDNKAIKTEDSKSKSEDFGQITYKLKPDYVKSLLKTVNYDQMSGDDFYDGPGKSELFTFQMKYEILYKILQNQPNEWRYNGRRDPIPPPIPTPIAM